MKAILNPTFFLVLALTLATSGAGADEKFATVGTNKIAYVVSGKDSPASPAFVLIHGWGGAKEIWEAQIKEIEKDFKVLALDLPGHGNSDKAPMKYTMKAFADAVNATLEHARIDRAILVGFSMGTPVMSRVYKDYPNKVAGLVALDGSLRPFPMTKEQMDEWMEPYRTGKYQDAARQFFSMLFPNPGTEKMRDHTIELFLKTPAHVLLQSFEAMADGPSWELQKIECPLLVLNSNSPMWNDDYVAHVKKIQPSAECKTIEGTGHFVMLEKPAEVTAALKRFGQGLSASAKK